MWIIATLAAAVIIWSLWFAARARTKADATVARADAELAASDERLQSLIALSSDWYWEQDRDFRFTRIYGPRSTAVTVVSPGELIGKSQWEVGGLETSPDEWARHRAQLERHEPFRDFVIKRAVVGSAVVWQSTSGDPVFDALGVFTGYRGIGRDVTARVRDQEHISRLAYHDNLTGLPNRSLLHDRLAQALAQVAREKHNAAALFLDLDHFKQINDALGHEAGDAVLRESARRLGSCLRAADTLGRIGGDEFLVLLPEIHHATDAAHVAAKLVDVMAPAFRVAGQDVRVGVSVGIALAPHDGGDAATLIRNADAAMYQAKQEGGHQFRFFTADLNADTSSRLALEADLAHALERHEFSLAYQPLVDLKTGAVAGVEALLRWRRRSGPEVVPAADFIRVCEDLGVIHDVGAWVLTEACRQAAAWRRDGIACGAVTVNVSTVQLHHPEFHAHVERALNASALEPSRLRLEVSESVMLDRRDATFAGLARLRELGVALSLDDFGTGYSSLAHLKHLPVDTIKIDRSFLKDVDRSTSDTATVLAMLTLARGLGLGTVAEGVETEAQVHRLRLMGCPTAQGFYFARPLDAAGCTAFLSAAGSGR